MKQSASAKSGAPAAATGPARPVGPDAALRSVFFPDFGNQGQEMSGHILWSADATLQEARVRVPAGLRLVHLYNIPATAVTVERGERSATIKAVKENGYIGFVVQSARLPEPDCSVSVRCQVKLTYKGDQQESDETRDVRLIRPEVSISPPARTTKVRFLSNQASPQVSDPIVVSNSGKATALLIVTPKAGSTFEIVDYFDAEAKTRQLVDFLKGRFADLKADYRDQRQLLELWTEYVELAGAKKTDDAFKLIPRLQRDIRHAERADPIFIEDLGSVFDEAFRVNFTADEKFTGWIKGFDAMRTQNMVLLNPWTSIKMARGRHPIAMDVTAYDQLGNEQVRFKGVKATVEMDADGLLPYFQLFQTEQLPPAAKGGP